MNLESLLEKVYNKGLLDGYKKCQVENQNHLRLVVDKFTKYSYEDLYNLKFGTMIAWKENNNYIQAIISINDNNQKYVGVLSGSPFEKFSIDDLKDKIIYSLRYNV